MAKAKKIVFGEIPGIQEGHWFENRKKMMIGSFHRQWAGGIDGNGKDGVAAIVLSGGYEDDEDWGNVIIYTGAGGNKSGKQISDQTWENKGNAGLLVSMDQGLPVRVIRGYKHKSNFSPQTGYTYAGLYSVVRAWREDGKSGFKICRVLLEYCGNNAEKVRVNDIELNYSKGKPERKNSTVLRTIRDTKMAHSIKQLYKYECQVCGFTIKTKVTRYAEGAHIRPLGIPHNGDDCADNIICLCPNHHVMFDKGLFSISDNLQLIGSLQGKLNVHKTHKLNIANLKYHRECHGFS